MTLGRLGIVVFLMSFLIRIAGKFYDLSLTGNEWIDAIMWGVLMGAVVMIITKFDGKDKS